MKTTCLFHASLAGVALAAPLASAPITPEEISARYHSTPAGTEGRELSDAGTSASQPVADAPVKASEILSDGKNWTLVPKGSVIHVPQELSNRVDAKPVGILLSWDDFLAVNRGWLFTEEITRQQAAGEVAIPASRTDHWRKVGKVIVAIHHGGPFPVRVEASAPVAISP